MNNSSPVSIVGAGTWLLSIDCIGPCVLERIQGRYGPEVELCEVGNTGLALLDHLHEQELMLIVDAGILDGNLGQIQVIEPDLDQPQTNFSSVHQIGPIETLAIAKRLFVDQMPKHVLLILVETSGMDDKLCTTACEQVIAILDHEIEKYQNAQHILKGEKVS